MSELSDDDREMSSLLAELRGEFCKALGEAPWPEKHRAFKILDTLDAMAKALERIEQLQQKHPVRIAGGELASQFGPRCEAVYDDGRRCTLVPNHVSMHVAGGGVLQGGIAWR